MDSSVTYKIVSLGEYLEGYTPKQVQQVFAQRFKLSEAKTARMLEKKCTLKKGVSSAQAKAFQQKLESIGLKVAVETEGVDSLSVERQVDAAQQASSENDVAGHGVTNPKVEAAVVSEANASLKPLALFAALIAACAGTVAWYYAATTFEYELGVLAWVIGGVAGAVGSTLGARGTAAAVLCGLLTLVAVTGGKYLTLHSVQQQISAEMKAAYQTPALREVYTREVENAKDYKKKVVDEASRRAFIVSYGYSTAMTPSELSSTDIRTFNETTVPRLEKLASGTLTFEQWGSQTFGQQIKPASVWALARHSVGWLDFVFLLLGIGTAFMLVRGRKICNSVTLSPDSGRLS